MGLAQRQERRKWLTIRTGYDNGLYSLLADLRSTGGGRERTGEGMQLHRQLEGGVSGQASQALSCLGGRQKKHRGHVLPAIPDSTPRNNKRLQWLMVVN